MDLLVTLDQNYLGPLRVLLGSLFLNDPGEEFHIYMIEEGLTGAQVEELSQLCRAHHSQLHPLEVPDGLFTDAPVVRYYSRAMYYRLLAAELLPRELDRVLYLDPDILVIRPVRPLYETQLGDSLLAAASHSGLTGMSDYVNKIRLSNYEAESYYNSGAVYEPSPDAGGDAPGRYFRLRQGVRGAADPAGPGHPQRPVRHPDPGCGRQCVEL